MKPKKIPMRKCIACQQSEEKRNLFRVVRSPEGRVFLDLTGRSNGRGAYLSKNKACIEKARSKNLLQKHLQAPVDDSVYEEMLAHLGDSPDDSQT
nr:YlxR family protein [Caenibacillus caldisaponilyticus]